MFFTCQSLVKIDFSFLNDRKGIFEYIPGGFEFFQLPVSLQVPGARCQVSENSTSKLDKMNECIGKSMKKQAFFM